jgi:effector-binding domain-containing protein
MEEPQRKHIEPQTVAGLEHTGAYGEIGSVYHKLRAWARRTGVKPTGPAFTVFLQPPNELNWQAGSFEVCLPVPAGTATSGDVRIKHLPAAEVLSVVVAGPYSEVPAHYAEFLAWIDIEGATVSGPPREVYLVHPGPGGTADPQKLRTEIQFPVAPEE